MGTVDFTLSCAARGRSLLYLAWTEAERWRAAGLFAGGFVVAMLPWLWRSYRLGASPFFNLNWYEGLANTTNYPGGWVWRPSPCDSSS